MTTNKNVTWCEVARTEGPALLKYHVSHTLADVTPGSVNEMTT